MKKGAGKGAIAFLWDESFLWGIMAYKALREAGLPFRLIRAADIGTGALLDCSALVVPGGWASHKIKVLGEPGISGIRQFVKEGGMYIGFCGGAGLATSDGIGLLDARRKPTSRRVPSFSGRIRLMLRHDPLWKGIDDPVFRAWWPSQLIVGEGVSVLARYGEALADAFSSDLNVGDALAAGGWEELEEYYGINLDPGRMLNEPSVMRGAYGRGTVLLSLVHFDSPGDANGKVVLGNLWSSLGERGNLKTAQDAVFHAVDARPAPLVTARPALVHEVNDLKRKIDGLIELGVRNFLWFRQDPFLLHWRRGVRGLEYCTLKVMMDELAQLITGSGMVPPSGVALTTESELEKRSASTEAALADIRKRLVPFLEEARLLLLRERRAMAREKLTFEHSVDPHIRAARERLFSTSKSHGGLFKQVIDRMDSLLWSLLAYRHPTGLA